MKRIVSLALIIFVFVARIQGQDVVIDTVLYFDFDKYTVAPAYNSLLTVLSDQVKKDTSTWVEISGHADITGTDAYNDKLSLKRTETVIKSFHKAQVKAERIKGYHYGSKRPIASNETKTGRMKNRRVEVKVYRKADVQEAEASLVSLIPEAMPLRTEIDIHYNKEKFAYLDNSHRSIIHTVRQAEFIIDTNTFKLPVRSNLYKNEKVRIDFSEMDKIGEMVYYRVGLRSDKNELLSSSYIMCVDSITNHGLAHIRKGKSIEFLIPESYVTADMNLYHSPDHDRKHWRLTEKPQYDGFHNCYIVHLKDEGCFAIARKDKVENPVTLSVAYSSKSKEAKLKKAEPQFFFVFKDRSSVVAADSVSEGKAYFNNIPGGVSGTIIGIVDIDPSFKFLAKEEITVKTPHNNNKVHNHGHVKFKPCTYFELDKALLNLHRENF